jgi:hypothetical protein
MPRSVRHILILGVLLCVSLVSASDPQLVSIHTLLSPQAGSYQRRMVTVEGVATDVSVQARVWTERCTLYGRGTFMLDDDTGIIPVDLLGSCTPAAADALPKDGDQIRLTVIVHVLQSGPPRHVRLQAMNIQILEAP